jgi:dTMP kinase
MYNEEISEIAEKIKKLKDIPHFIAFEGVEGSGKTTQAKNLGKFLKKIGYKVFVAKDPGTTKLGEKIRKILKSEANIDAISELFLFLAARRQLVEEIIKPEIRKGKIIISDRFTHSTLAYQGRGRLTIPETLPMLCFIATGGVEPELTIVLDINPEIGLARVKERYQNLTREKEDRFEKEDLEFHRRIREYYIELSSYDENVVLVDASQDLQIFCI